MQLYEQVTSVVQELQSKFPMPSESKLRSIYREVLQDQIINKKHIFYNSNYTKLVENPGISKTNKQSNTKQSVYVKYYVM